LGAETDIQEIMGDVLGLIKSFFKADFVWLLAKDEAGNFVLRSSTEALKKDDAMLSQASVNSFERFVMDEKKPFALSDIQAETKFYFGPQTAGQPYKATIAVPMFIAEKPVGVFSLYYCRSRIFCDEELHFLEIIGNILAVSLERADYYAKAIHEKELSDTILQSVTDGILTVDTCGKILSFNKSFEKMIGLLPENTIGLPACNVFRLREGNEHFIFQLRECFDAALGGKALRKEADLATTYGNIVPVLISSAPIQSMDGEVTGVVNLLRNISREKEIDRMKTEIIRSVSHEFRTPLSAIVGMTEMLLNRDIAEDKARQYLNIIRSEGIRLSKMVSELLSIARIETGKESLKLSSFDVNALVLMVLESFKAQSESKEADIRYQEDGPVYFVGDEEKIKQLLFNILDNSLSFSDNKCVIEIGINRKPEILEITVSDSGWGIPEEDILHSVERFYRGKHGSKIKGTGLGLSLCDEILKMHGGSMQISSKEGEGTSIILGIPYREAQ
jgi:PAS domain S-box-containing protein